MNVLSNLVPFGGLLEKVFDRVFPNPEDKAKAQLEVLAMQQKGELAELAAITEGDKAQAEVNKVEAASESLFVSGWRPAVGWICAAALFAQYIGAPLVTYIGANAFGWTIPPRMDFSELLTLLFGLLGLGYFRTLDKKNAKP
ncbi:3TM-type holin [Variovorax sp. V15]|uniref:3TM-type holin n=1 Tax=Variovorax sp. V15 TaxID=3065952 RepID=UPI0034E8EE2B